MGVCGFGFRAAGWGLWEFVVLGLGLRVGVCGSLWFGGFRDEDLPCGWSEFIGLQVRVEVGGLIGVRAQGI